MRGERHRYNLVILKYKLSNQYFIDKKRQTLIDARGWLLGQLRNNLVEI